MEVPLYSMKCDIDDTGVNRTKQYAINMLIVLMHTCSHLLELQYSVNGNILKSTDCNIENWGGVQ